MVKVFRALFDYFDLKVSFYQPKEKQQRISNEMISILSSFSGSKIVLTPNIALYCVHICFQAYAITARINWIVQWPGQVVCSAYHRSTGPQRCMVPSPRYIRCEEILRQVEQAAGSHRGFGEREAQQASARHFGRLGGH
ncbi:hypothetical protein CEXT_555811 [Caerostris extrusa]|uniref:Uncharacterized protein n=1 Tax=Caerostris extrusa TaxID=172846 RepID=A0AAV4XID8_CAEEX|nr:hypothetical protein CEXT_555811 [Caerostris extrusa]